MINIVCWPKRINFGAETSPWWWSYEHFCLPIDRHCSNDPLQCLLAVQLSGKAHKDSDYTAMSAIVYWRLHAKTHPGGKVVSAVITFVSFSLPLLVLLNGMVVMCDVR